MRSLPDTGLQSRPNLGNGRYRIENVKFWVLLLTHLKHTKERERDRRKRERDTEKMCVINTFGCVNNTTFFLLRSIKYIVQPIFIDLNKKI